jgi:hypothetical protein
MNLIWRTIKGAGGVWDRFWFGEISAYPVAAFRILFGIFLLVKFGVMAGNVPVLFSSEGVYAPFLIPDLALPPLAALAVFLLYLGLLILMIAGYRARRVVPLVLVFYLYFYLLNIALNNTAHDRLNVILLFFLMFARSDRVWSVNAGKKGGPEAAAMGGGGVPAWPSRVIALQISFVYFGAGLWKLMNPYWHQGEMLRMTLVGPWASDLGFWFVSLGWPSWFYLASVWAVIIFEIALAFALWIRKIQIPAMIAGFLFHLSIGLMLNIPEFLNCVAAYVLFLPGEQVKRAGETIAGRWFPAGASQAREPELGKTPERPVLP